jgi:preprotein translocase subunit SecG
MQNILLVIHLILAVVLIGAILLQRSEGGALGIGGGSGGGPGNIFSARGVGNGLTRLTAILAVGFFITSAALTVIVTRGTDGSIIKPVPDTNGLADPAPGGVLPNLGQGAPAAPAAPAAPVNN